MSQVALPESLVNHVWTLVRVEVVAALVVPRQASADEAPVRRSALVEFQQARLPDVWFLVGSAIRAQIDGLLPPNAWPARKFGQRLRTPPQALALAIRARSTAP